MRRPPFIAAVSLTAMWLAVQPEAGRAGPAMPQRAPATARSLPPSLSIPQYELQRLLGPSALQETPRESYRVGQLHQALLDLQRGKVPTIATVPQFTPAQVQLALRLLDEFVSDLKLTDDNLVRLYYEEEAGRLVAISISRVQLTQRDRIMRGLLRHEGRLIEVYLYRLVGELVFEELRAEGAVDELRDLLGLPLTWCMNCPPKARAWAVLGESRSASDAAPSLRIESVGVEGMLSFQPDRLH